MLRRLLTASALLALGSLAQAHAADLVTKAAAAPAVVGYPYNASGFYFGVGTSGTGSQASVANAGVVALGASLDGIVGWQWQGGLNFIAIENIASYQNLGTTGTCIAQAGITGCSVGSNFSDTLRVKFGFPTTMLSTFLPNLSAAFPGLPAVPGGSNGTLHPYGYVGLRSDDVSGTFMLSTARAWTFRAEVGLGVMSQLTNGMALDTSAGFTFAGQGLAIGVPPGTEIGAQLGKEFTARVSLLY